VSRLGRGVLTGIDRVELAYLDHLCALDRDDTRYLCRTTRGVILLDRRGGQALARLAHGSDDLPQADAWSRLTLRGALPRHRAEAALRAHTVDRAVLRNLPRMIARSSGAGPMTYLNTGHSNLSETVLGPMRAAKATIAVLIHDLIPLTHPETVVPDLPKRFAGRLERVRRHADLVICNSGATRDELFAYWAEKDRVPKLCVAHLGITPAEEPPTPCARSGFVMLGTIEARKNHALILDVWDMLATKMDIDTVPKLHIIGPRGWKVEGLLRRLEQHPLKDRVIFEHGALSESDTRAHLSRATALLFPTIAEGYGYPPLEALSLGTLPVVSDLPVLRETLGPSAVYLPVNDAYSWLETTEKLLDGRLFASGNYDAVLPDWRSHFITVADALGQGRVKGSQ